MFGYVRPSEARLSEADKERFAAAYCGLCRTLGERYGLASRFILNYDFAFLAILLWEGEVPEPLHRGRIAHPAGKRPYFPGNAALELAADYSVILARWQAADALADRCTATNPRPCTKEDIIHIYHRAYAGRLL